MDAPQADVQASMVAKCQSGFYQIEQVHMDSGYSGFPDLSTPVFALHRPTNWEYTQAPSILHKVSFARNALTPNVFAQHFSALRYGCSLTEDLTDYSIDALLHQPEQIAIDCWRWLAFALFYPRPKRFAQAYKLHTIGKLTIDSVAIRAIIDTVRDPVAQLVYNKLEEDGSSTPEHLMVCTVEEGSRIELFVSGAMKSVDAGIFKSQFRSLHPRHKTIFKTTEFEALCERDDGSVCVVVPGVGLGWVDEEDVLLLEREPLNLARSTLGGIYSMSIRIGRHKTDVRNLGPLFDVIGHQIQSLTFACTLFHENRLIPGTLDYSSGEDSVVQYIRERCMHVKHLRLIQPPYLEFSALLLALEGSNLTSQLLTLDLNNRLMNDIRLERLVSALEATMTPLALQELRVNYYSIAASPIARLHKLLAANGTVRLVELYDGRANSAPMPQDAEWLDEIERLDTAFQGQLLHSYSPMRTKLAFLSVVNEQFASCLSAGRIDRLALPEILLTRILGFAACLEIRRVIAWNTRPS